MQSKKLSLCATAIPNGDGTFSLVIDHGPDTAHDLESTDVQVCQSCKGERFILSQETLTCDSCGHKISFV